MELVHIGFAIGIHPRQQRHDVGEFIKVRPIDDNAYHAGNGNQMQGVVGRATRGHQADYGIDDAALIQHFPHTHRLCCLCQQCGLYGSLFDQCRAQLGMWVYKRAGGQMQAHEFHQHLVGIGRAVKRAGASAVVRR